MTKQLQTDYLLSTKSYRTNYKLGLVYGIRNILSKMKKHHEDSMDLNTKNKTGSLVIVKKDAISEYIENNYPKLRKMSTTSCSCADAFYHGEYDSNKIQLHAAVRGKKRGGI